MAAPTSSDGLADAIWNLLASVRLTFVLLLSLAATSIIGTLIPQNNDPAAYVSAFGETLFRFFGVLGLFDMYHSWWFQVLMVLLAVNIVVCSIDRISSQRHVLFVRRPHFKADAVPQPAGPGRLRGRAPARNAAGALRSPSSRARRSAVQVEAVEGGFRIFGERGRWTRFGVYAVHLSVVLLLVGGLIGSLFGFDAFVTIPEGETVQQVVLRNTGQRLRLPFAIRCDDFERQLLRNRGPQGVPLRPHDSRERDARPAEGHHRQRPAALPGHQHFPVELRDAALRRGRAELHQPRDRHGVHRATRKSARRSSCPKVWAPSR